MSAQTETVGVLIFMNFNKLLLQVKSGQIVSLEGKTTLQWKHYRRLHFYGMWLVVAGHRVKVPFLRLFKHQCWLIVIAPPTGTWKWRVLSFDLLLIQGWMPRHLKNLILPPCEGIVNSQVNNKEDVWDALKLKRSRCVRWDGNRHLTWVSGELIKICLTRWIPFTYQ